MDVSAQNHRYVEEQRVILKLRNRTVQRGCDSLLLTGADAGRLLAEGLLLRYVRAAMVSEA